MKAIKTHTDTDSNELAAVRLACSLGRQVVLRSVVERRRPSTSSHAAPALPSAPDFSSERCLEWEDAGVELRAWGHIDGFVAQRSEQLAELEQRVLGDTAVGLPTWVGFRSFSGLAGQDEWSGWPGVEFWLPRHVRVRIGDREIHIDHRCVQASGKVESFSPAPAAAVGPNDAEPSGALHLLDEGDRASWAQAIEQALQAFKAGDLRKVVLSRRARFKSTTPLSPTRVFQRLGEGSGLERSARHSGVTRYRLNWPGHGEFIGRTPETLVHLSPGRVATEALAGTAPSSEAQALIESDKDQREHALVVEALEEHLASECADVETDGPKVATFGDIAHIRTEITATPQHARTLLHWIEKLHPSPAVAGTPQRPAMDFIRRVEPTDRGGYAGVLAWTDGRSTGRAIVALRCALVRPHHTYVYAGGGIVPGSTADMEWRETQLKMARLARTLDAPADPTSPGEGRRG